MGVRSGEAGFGDDDRLPWLETVEEDYREGPSIWRILLLIVLGLAVLGAIVFGVWWYQKQQGLSGNGELIAAPAEDYKVPDSDAGAKLEGADSATTVTREGGQPDMNVSAAASAEDALDVQRVAAPKTDTSGGTAKARIDVPETRGTLEAKSPKLSTGSGAIIQLGAFPDQQGAEQVWARMTGKFPELSRLGKSIERGASGGDTVYRLRVNTGGNDQAKELCAKLKGAGENCYVAN